MGLTVAGVVLAPTAMAGAAYGAVLLLLLSKTVFFFFLP